MFLLFVVVLSGVKSSAQSISNYTFASSSGTFTNLSGASYPSIGGGTADEGYATDIPIGFDFWYMGAKYTTISASSNGWISLDADITAANPTNNLNTGGSTNRPIIAPLWDDLDDVSTSNVSYVTTGTAGSRIFTIQYLNVKWSRTATAATISYQVKLYEGTGIVQFVYRPEAGTVAGASASIGITGTATGSGNFLSLNGSGATPTVSSTTETTTISAKPSSGRTFSFTPPVPAAPTNLTFSSVTSTSMTLNWTDNSASVEKGFLIYRSTDGVNYNFISQVAANTTSSAQSGLSISTTYYWKVYAISEGGFSTTLSGSRATACASLNISQIPTSNIILNYKFAGNASSETGSNNGTLQNSPVQTTDRFGIPNKAYTFNGTSQYVSTANSYSNPTNFSISVWFRTNTTSGGLLVGFGNAQTGSSGSHDRKIYMNNAGQIYFGVYSGATFTINSTSSYNDSSWHLATGTLSSTTGMVLYIDGAQVASGTQKIAENSTGYWKIGFDNLSGWPSTHNSDYFNGALDDALVYHAALTSTQVATLYNSADGAGNNGPACEGSSLGLTATTIAGATYSWSGPNGFTSSSQNPTLTYSSAYAGVYSVLITSGGCSATAYTKVETSASSAVISYTGSPYCKTAGAASVTFAGATGGTFTSTAGLTINSSTGVITPATSTAGTYTVSYSNGGCIATTNVTIIAAPTTASAGPNQTGSSTCGLTSVTLAGNTPTVGTGAWTIVSGSGGSLGNAASATSTFSGTAGNTYTLRWTISNGSCTPSTADVVITFNRAPTTANAGPNQTSAATCGLTTVTLAGNTPAVGTGAWTIVSGTGGSFGNAASATSTFSGIAGNTYTLRWTISNSPCTVSTADVVITFNQSPTTASAGPNQTGSSTCGLTTVTLAGNTPTVGTGAWAIVSGTGGSFGNAASATSTFSGTAGNTYTLRWTISNGSCAASTADVVITFNQSPTTANAGPNQTSAATCGLTIVTLAGNTPTVGTGAWTIVSGTGGSFGNAASATSTFSGIAGNTYTLRWTISNGTCTASTADVVIAFNRAPTTSNAGPDQTSAATCGLTTVTLAANAPAIGTGAWSIVSGTGGTVTTLTNPASTFSGSAGTTYTLRWTISNNPCAASTDDVVITFNLAPTTANAGADQTSSATCGLTTVTLAGNTPVIGTGVWTIISGTGGSITTPANATSTFTGTAGTTYTLRWTTSNGPCSSYDDVVITFNQNASATISYAVTPFCVSAVADQTVTQTGTAGGTYSSTAGLTINPVTGAITPSTSTPATYTVTYTIVNGPCTTTATTSVQVLSVIGNNQLDYTNVSHGVLCVTQYENNPAVLTAPAGSVFVNVGFASYGTPGGTCSAFTLGSCHALTSQSTAESYLLGNNTATIPATNAVFGDPCNGTLKMLYVQGTYTQPICSGTSPGTISGTTPTGGSGTYTYLWEKSTTSSSAGFTPATGTNNTINYIPGVITQTTWFRRTVTSGSCSNMSAVILVVVNPLPTTAAAGADQSGAATCGLTIVTLAGNTPTVGTGVWTIISGTGGVITTPASATSTFSGTAGNTYTLRWTILNSPCTSSTDDVIITFNQAPTTSNAGADQSGAATCGLTTVTLAGNTPTIGTGVWSIISGTGGIVTTPTSATSTFSGTSGNTYTLRWTISNGSCTTSTDDVVISFTQSPSTSNAGADQTGPSTCGLTMVTLAGNTPTIGTGVWTIISGTGGVITTSTSTTSTFSGTSGNTYTLRWTISNGSCTSSTDDVTITFNQAPTSSNAGADQLGAATCGLTTVTLAGNTPTIGTGVWSIVSGTGGIVTTPASATSTFSGTSGNTYTLRWTISNGSCTTSTDDVVITFSQSPSTSNAGADQTGASTCGLTIVTLAGNTPTIGTGVWSIISGTGGIITTPASATSTFNGTAGNTYTLRWTISNGSCTASTDDVVITFNRAPTTANAGIDQTGATTCGLTTVTLAGNTPTVGTGVWSIISGTGGIVTTPASATSTFSGTAGNTYTLRWTISNSPCASSSDDVIITFNQTPTISNAGADQTGSTTCGLTMVTLAGNTPTVGTGVWTIISGTGGIITTPASATSTFSGTSGNTYTLRWTISNGSCASSTDDVIITFNQTPTVSNAGADQISAATCGLTTVTLAGNTPTVGTGVWSIISGTSGIITTPTSATSTFSGSAGNTYTLRWTISNGSCTVSTDDVVITFNRAPTIANAGADQTGASTCGLTIVTLAGNTPTIGTGVWTIISGTGGVITTSTSATSTFSGTAGNTYTLRWTISNSPCASSTDDVIITFNQAPTTSNAGADQSGAATCGLTIVTLAGNTPTIGTGVWSIISGTGGIITTPASATSTFSGTSGNTYTLRWTISNGSCTPSTDDVVITFSQSPSTSNAGADQTGASTCGLTMVTLAGNTPTIGTGVWSIISGTGGIITTPASATSTFSGTAGNTYTLRWTISNGSCTASTDDVVITFNRAPTTANAGADQISAATCGLTIVTLAGNTPTIGTGVWSIISGTGGVITTSTSATSTFSGTAGNTYTLRWTISNGSCTASTDDVVITFNRAPTTANAGADQTGATTCGLTSVTLAGNVPAIGTGVWTIISGTGGTVTASTSATSTFSGTAGNTYTLRWTISNGSCTSADDVVITFNQYPSATISYAGTPFCTSVITAQSVTQTGTAGGTYSSTAGLSINASTGAITPSTSTPATYLVTYTMSGTCTATATTSVTITAGPSATISYSGGPFCSTAGISSVTRTGTAGGVYSSGAGLSINASTGDVTPSTSMPGVYTVTYTVAAANGCAQFQTTTSVTINLAGTWTGAISTDWKNIGNWFCGSVPGKTDDVSIPGGLSKYPFISQNVSAHNITISSGATVNVEWAILSISGSITNNGTLNATKGSIEMNGSSAQTVPASAFSSNLIKDLTVNNTAGVSLAGSLSLTDVLTISSGSLTTGGFLTLKSDSTNTARVGKITSASPTPIIGNVTVERFVAGRRKYRLLTSSVTTSTSSTLTAGQEALSIWGNWQNAGVNNPLNTGMLITGGTSADGFDTQTSNASLYTYKDSTRSYSGFTSGNGKNTKYTPLKAGVAYYAFVYGDRQNSITASIPRSTVLKATGTLLTGNQLYTTSSSIPISGVSGRFTLLGNPYASIIDWKSVSKLRVSKTIWGWDANMNSTGAYVTVTATTSGAIVAPVSSLVKVSRYVQPGQGFFIQTIGSNPQLLISESDKVDSSKNVANGVFRTTGSGEEVQPLLAMNLLYDNGATKVLADGAVAAFDTAFSNLVDDEDGIKMTNTAEGIAIVKDGNLLGIETRQEPKRNDTIALNFAKLTRASYTLEIFASQWHAGNLQAYLIDNVLQTEQQLSLIDTNRTVFSTITSAGAAVVASRFSIVFRQSTVLPVTFTSIKATRKEKNIQVEWQVETEIGIQKYQVERSTDGVNFTQVAEVNAKGFSTSGGYQWLDANVSNGHNYYRVKAIQADGKYLFTTVVLVVMQGLNPEYKVYPNPVRDQQVNLQFSNVEKGSYRIILSNTKGQRVMYKLIDHPGGTLTRTIFLGSSLPAGMYYLQVIKDTVQFNQSIIIR